MNAMFASTLTIIASQLVSIIDEGKAITNKELEHQLDHSKDIFAFLQQKFPNTFHFSILSQIDKEFLIDKYSDIHFTHGPRKFGTENNGLSSLLAYTIELIQRERTVLREKGHEFQLEIDPNEYSGRDDSQT